MNIELSGILDRISKLEGVKTDADIAHILKVSPQTMSTWKRRGTVPYERICAFCSAKSHSLDYVIFGDKAAPTEVSVDLVNEVIAALRAPNSELREVKLELIVEQLVSMYNSVVGISSKPQREKVLNSYINLANKQILSNADKEILRFIESSAPFFRDNPEVINNLPDRVRTEAERLLKDVNHRKGLLKVTYNDTEEDGDELSA